MELHGVSDCFFHGIGSVATRFVDPFDDIDGRFQSGGCRGFAHQFDGPFQCVEQHSGAGPTDVGKETSFDGVEFGTIARIVSHADF